MFPTSVQPSRAGFSQLRMSYHLFIPRFPQCLWHLDLAMCGTLILSTFGFLTHFFFYELSTACDISTCSLKDYG